MVAEGARDSSVSLVVVDEQSTNRVRLTVRRDTRVENVVTRYVAWLRKKQPSQRTDDERSAHFELLADGAVVPGNASVASIAGEIVRLGRRRVKIKGAAAKTGGRASELLQQLRQLRPSLDVTEARFLVDLYQKNESVLSSADVLRYAAANLTVAAADEVTEAVLPTKEELSLSDEMVSVVVPTTGDRAAFHATLYECFRWQRYEPKELLILDTASVPSPFFDALQDPRVRYFNEPAHEPATGAKRNTLVARARGPIIAHFDDDDCYAPAYLERLIAVLRDADLVKLSSWLWLDASRFIARRDQDCVSWFDSTRDRTTGFDQCHSAAGWHSRKWGYGFSFVYRKRIAVENPFPGVFQGEDYDFLMRATAKGYKCLAFSDNLDDAVVLHVLHNNNSSVVARHALYSFSDLGRFFSLPRLSQLLSGMRDRGVFDTPLSTTLCLARKDRHFNHDDVS